jgi:hypothetical protein
MVDTEEEIIEDKKVEVTFNRNDLLTLLKACKKVLEVDELTALINDDNVDDSIIGGKYRYLEINELDRYHIMLLNAKFLVRCDENNKYVKLEYDKLKEIKDSEDQSITLNLNEPKSKNKPTLKVNFDEFNVISMSVQELSELIKASDILSCSIMKISIPNIEFYNDITKLIREVLFYEKKQENVQVHLSCEILSRINEILKYFNGEIVKIYFGTKNGEEQPVLFKIKSGYTELEIYIAPELKSK